MSICGASSCAVVLLRSYSEECSNLKEERLVTLVCVRVDPVYTSQSGAEKLKRPRLYRAILCVHMRGRVEGLPSPLLAALGRHGMQGFRVYLFGMAWTVRLSALFLLVFWIFSIFVDRGRRAMQGKREGGRRTQIRSVRVGSRGHEAGD